MIRPLTALFTAFALAGLVAACGDDDEKVAPAVVRAEFELAGPGDKAKMSGPASIEAGAVQVDFTNSTKDEAGVTLLRIEGDHTASETVKAGAAWGDRGKLLPAWIRFVGGTGSIKPGATFTSIQSLPAGKYVAVDINTNAYLPLEVTGDGPGELPATTANIDAQEYSFRASGLKAGRNRVLFTNKGKEPHFALMAPIKPGKTIDDVRDSLKEEEGPPPIDEKKTESTGILDGGESQVVEVMLTKGNYALVCFVADRKGGEPHAFLGMVSEGVVE